MLARRSLPSSFVGAWGRDGLQAEPKKGGPPAQRAGQDTNAGGLRRPEPNDIIISDNENPLCPGPDPLDLPPLDGEG